MRHGIGPDGTQLFPGLPVHRFTNIDGCRREGPAGLPRHRAGHRIGRASRTTSRSRSTCVSCRRAGARSTSRLDRSSPTHRKRPEWNRGAYLVDALAHCGECHTPRTRTGGIEHDKWFAGNADGPGGDPIPNITPDKDTGIGGWSEDDIIQYLSLGLTPDGDVAGSLMGEVIEFSTSKLTDADRKAIAVYVKSLPPIRNAVKRQ